MFTKISRQAILIAVTAPLAVLSVGCSGADDPQVVKAPAFVPPETTEPAKIPGKKGTYGEGKRYKDSMGKMVP